MKRGGNVTLFLGASVFLGTSFVGIKTGLDAVPPVLFAALRFDVAAVLLLAFVAHRFDAWIPRSRGDVLAVLASGAFVVALNNGLLFVGQQYTTSGAAAVMYGLMPVVSPVFTYLLLDDRVSRGDVVGILLGLAGVVVVVQPTPEQLGAGVFGQTLVVVAALSVALGSVLVQRAGPRLPMLPLASWSMLVGALALHAASFGLGEGLAVAWTADTVAAVAYVGVPGTTVAYAAYFLLIAQAGPVKANLVAYAVPAVATLSGWALLGERLAPTTLVGFVVILAGFALLQRAELVAEAERLRGEPPLGSVEVGDPMTDD